MFQGFIVFVFNTTVDKYWFVLERKIRIYVTLRLVIFLLCQHNFKKTGALHGKM